MAETTVIETHTADFTARIQHAQRADGQWFKRMQRRDPRYGYTWSAWSAVPKAPEGGRKMKASVRLPRGASEEREPGSGSAEVGAGTVRSMGLADALEAAALSERSMAGPAWVETAQDLIDSSERRAGKGVAFDDSQDGLHYRAYLRAIVQRNEAQATHLAKKYLGARKARQDLASEAGKGSVYAVGEASGAFPWSSASEANSGVGLVYQKLHTLKAAFDRMEEIPKDLNPLYRQAMKAIDAIVEAGKETEQLAGMVRREHGRR